MSVPKLARETEYGRGYVHPVTGELVPSVTTILKVIHKKELDYWAAKVAANYAVAHWDELSGVDPFTRARAIRGAPETEAREKADLGTAIHELCEKWMKGIPGELNKAHDPYMTQFTNFLAEHKPRVLESEVTVWSRKHEYAGTADMIAILGNRVAVIDVKTGRGLYPEMGLQLAALGGADFIIRDDGTEEPAPNMQDLFLLHLRPRSWRLVEVRERTGNFTTFLAARQVLRWMEETAPAVLAA